jgi:hypothetical protein
MKKPAPVTGSAGLNKVVLDETGALSSITTPADTATPPRRPCRVCKRPGARPVVPIGSSRWWDLCPRCTRVVTGAYRALGGGAP